MRRNRLKLDIVHYYAAEHYPPLINLIQLLESEKDICYQVYTTSVSNESLNPIRNSRIKRVINSHPQALSPIRVLKQAYFNIVTFIFLLRRNPDIILYYETISCAGPIIYKRYFNKNVRLMAHYHELTTQKQIKTETRLVRILNPLEKRTYVKHEWISHTNADRLRLFTNDYKKHIRMGSLQIMPNYPPSAWRTKKSITTASKKTHLHFPVRTILTGSVSSETMYLKEYCDWVIRQNGKFTFDIYSFNIGCTTRNYLDGLNRDLIRLHEACPYHKLPELFSNYDIGIILYKAEEENMRYNAPNKLFEYHTCGLDVWFPLEQETALSYTRSNTYPKIISVDFKHLDEVDYVSLLSRDGMRFFQQPFQSEHVYRGLIDAMLHN